VTRRRPFSRLTVWVFMGALLLKSAVPMLASAAAAAQGKGVAEICDVYGVATARVGAPVQTDIAGAPLAHAHAHDSANADARLHAAGHAHAPAPGGERPAHRVSHGGDHCVLTGMVALASVPPALAPPPAGEAITTVAKAAGAAPRDAVARWASLLGHGPPRRS
jgi:hypothetical protein